MKVFVAAFLVFLLSVTCMGLEDGWQLLFRQTINGEDKQLFKKNEWSRNKDNNEAPNFSRLEDFENFRRPDGTFLLFLWYPELEKGNEWRQSSNPVKQTAGGVENYEEIEISSPGNGWKGLEYNTRGTSLLDGSVDSSDWFYAIGATKLYNGGIPGPTTSRNTKVVRKVELYIFDDYNQGCSCSDETVDTNPGTAGRCLTQYKGRYFCYVKGGEFHSTCSDKQESIRASKWWSFEACENYEGVRPQFG